MRWKLANDTKYRFPELQGFTTVKSYQAKIVEPLIMRLRVSSKMYSYGILAIAISEQQFSRAKCPLFTGSIRAFGKCVAGTVLPTHYYTI